MQRPDAREMAGFALVASEIYETLQNLGLDPKKIFGEWSKGNARIKERLENTAPILVSAIAEIKSIIPTIFQWLENRRIPAALRLEEIDGSHGLDESMSMIALGNLCDIPNEITASTNRTALIEQVKDKLIRLEQQAQSKQLTEAEFGSLLDFAVKDEWHDIWLDVKSWLKKNKPELSKKLDAIFTKDMVKWSEKFAKPQPKTRRKRSFLQTIGVRK